MDSYPKVGMRKVDNFLTNYDVTKDNTWGGGGKKHSFWL